jgi:hypothetical protein
MRRNNVTQVNRFSEDPKDERRIVPLDIYEENMLINALRTYLKRLELEFEDLERSLSGGEDDWRMAPEVSGAEEWIVRTKDFIKRVEKFS